MSDLATNAAPEGMDYCSRCATWNPRGQGHMCIAGGPAPPEPTQGCGHEAALKVGDEFIKYLDSLSALASPTQRDWVLVHADEWFAIRDFARRYWEARGAK